MKKKNIIFSCIMLSILSLALCYGIYATTTTTARISNRISFEAGDDVFYKTDTKVYYQGEPDTPIFFYPADTGVNPVKGNSTWDAPSNIKFSKTKNVVVYEITVYNYTESKISASIVLPELSDEDATYITNVKSEAQEIGKFVAGDIKSATLTITTTWEKYRYSHSIVNNIQVVLERV